MSTERKSGDASESITFRLKPDVLMALRKESDRNGVTLNALVGQVLGHFIGWSSTAARAGFMPVPRQMIALLLHGTPDEKVAEVGRAVAAGQASDILLLKRGSVTEEALIAIFEAWLKEANVPYSKNVMGGSTKIVMQHDLGVKWSLLISRCCRRLTIRSLAKRSGRTIPTIQQSCRWTQGRAIFLFSSQAAFAAVTFSLGDRHGL